MPPGPAEPPAVFLSFWCTPSTSTGSSPTISAPNSSIACARVRVSAPPKYATPSPSAPASVATRSVTIGRLPSGFSAAPASGSSAGNSTIWVRVPVIFIASPRGRGGVDGDLREVAPHMQNAQCRECRDFEPAARSLTECGRSGIAQAAPPPTEYCRRPGTRRMTRSTSIPTAGLRDTFPKMLIEHARSRPHRPAMREKDYGIWQSWNWGQVAAEVEALACGLKALGFRRGDKLAIVGDNRPRLYWAIAAAQALGG